MSVSEFSKSAQVFSANPWLSTYGGALVQAMYPNGGAPKQFDVKPLVQTSARLVLKITTEDKTVLLKAFNSDEREARIARYREIAVLANLRQTDLIAPLIGYSKAQNWILSDFIDGPDLQDVLTEDTLLDHAHALGHWYRRFSARMEAQAVEEDGDWYSYLMQYDPMQRGAMDPEKQDLLRDLPIRQRLVAKNDPYFRNFIQSPELGLIGVDFEKAEIKPHGFDIISTGRLLVRLYPHRLFEVTEALVDGWGGGTDVLDRDQLLEVTRLFASATAFAVVHDADKRLHKRWRAYNATAPAPARQMHESPFMADRLVTQDPDNRQKFIAEMERLVAGETAEGPVDEATNRIRVQPAPTEDPTTPRTSHEVAFCGTCKGSCCKQGATNFGFIRVAHLEKTKASLDLDSLSDAIAHYAGMIPDQHVEGSCYFHGQDGCTLPRDQRSDVCNSYKCLALRTFLSASQRLEPDQTAVVYASDGTHARRATRIGPDGAVPVDPALLDG